MRPIFVFLLAVGLSTANLAWGGEAVAAPPAPFVMGMSDSDELTHGGRWVRRIYIEAFRRLGIPFELHPYPLKRLTGMVNEGSLDGEIARVHGYGDAYPNMVRVEEPILDIEFALFASAPARSVRRLEELASGRLLAEYRRGVGVCERILKEWVPAERLSDVATTEQGVRKLLAGRTDVYCDLVTSVESLLHEPEFRGITGVGKVLDLGKLPLYPYLHRKHAALAPRLAAALKRLKAEGVVERYRIETERELGWSQ